MRKPAFAICEQQRRRSACWFASYLVCNVEDRFSRDVAHFKAKQVMMMMSQTASPRRAGKNNEHAASSRAVYFTRLCELAVSLR